VTAYLDLKNAVDPELQNQKKWEARKEKFHARLLQLFTTNDHYLRLLKIA
jgi:hypothetical protein